MDTSLEDRRRLQVRSSVAPMVMFDCPGCKQKLQVDGTLAGKRVKCSRCSQVLLVPDGVSSAAARPTINPVVEERTLPPRNGPEVNPPEAATVAHSSPRMTDAATMPPAPGAVQAKVGFQDAKMSATSAGSNPVRQAELLPTIPGFEVLGVLGRGGMGVVYKAQQAGLKRLVALKMILSGAYADQGERTRFVREAEAVARLQHPNIVQITRSASTTATRIFRWNTATAAVWRVAGRHSIAGRRCQPCRPPAGPGDAGRP